MNGPASTWRVAGQRGAGLVEVLVALPVLLLFGMMLVQLALVYQARSLLDNALHEAVRAASLEHASPTALHDGLARGMAPMMMQSDGLAGHAAARVRARVQIEAGLIARWIRLRQLAPFAESYDDWDEPALDDDGRPSGTQREIPIDNLDGRRTRMKPNSGSAGAGRRGAAAGDEPIGMRSGQTLVDANLLKVSMTYGVPLNVPVAGPALRLALMAAYGCVGLGAVRHTDDCVMIGVHHRLPVVLSSTARMMSASRRSSMTPSRAAAGG